MISIGLFDWLAAMAEPVVFFQSKFDSPNGVFVIFSFDLKDMRRELDRRKKLFQ